ncbi:Dihydrofolate reductase [Streptomyces zhaozhouensis]|uniref:Dihydrofolate reductase n=1 Tax=Streptomyces zhaozhouensis TaxID=1300267 RepID=A0A286DUC2_9ACTN|nr:dihydrofolate reductase family protein [Streptomyces zhaozhouensis]SOD62259.1 Dihydrofolate reductase [Streptomyces zhaozhouensis]
MRKLVSCLFVSLDGVAESPDQWQFAFDEEMGEAVTRSLEGNDTVLMGATTFTEWSGYWPSVTEGEDAGFADWINGAPKYVASTTLTSVDEWPGSRLLEGGLAEAVGALKEGEGGGISVAGSPSLVASLLEAGLLDELVLLIHPVIAGGGRRKLFADDAPLRKLTLVEARPTGSGVIIATYRPAR